MASHMKGCWLLPSLGRPGLLKEFIDAYNQTNSTTDVWVLVDEKDPSYEAYKALKMPQKFLFVDTGDKVTMGDKVRKVFDTVKQFDWVGILNDDHRPRTDKWDQAVISQVQGHNVVFTNDAYVNANGPTRIAGAICFSGRWLRALGYMFLPGQHHLYSDDLWQALCQRPQCAFYLHDVLVEHDHAYKNPNLQDDTFFKINGPKGLNAQTRVGEGGFWPNDSEVFGKWASSPQAEEDIQKIMDIQPKIGVMLATACHDHWVAMDYALGLSDFSISLTQQNMYFEMARVLGSSLLPHARNSLVDMFMKSRCQRLLFIDADQGFDKAICWPLFRSSRRIVAAVTPHKRFPINLNFEPLEKDKKYFKDLCNKSYEEFQIFAKERADQNGEIEVNRCGTGIICIDRSVFDILGKDTEEYLPFDNSDRAVHKEYFKMGITKSSRRYKGEDWHFCEEAKEKGIPLYINVTQIVKHQGVFSFGS